MRCIRLEELPWTMPAEGVRYRSAVCDGRKVRLLEFAPGFAEAEWCGIGHTGYVLEGMLEVAFADGTEVFARGDVIMIREGDMHRARVMEGPVRLFLVEKG